MASSEVRILSDSACTGNQFLTVNEIRPDENTIIHARVSKPDYACNLPHQVSRIKFELCWATGWHHGLCLDESHIVDVVTEVASGTSLERGDRPKFWKVVDRAKAENLIVVAQDINRLVRHPKYGPRWKPRPRHDQIAELLDCGVTFALVVPFTASERDIKSHETRRGRLYKDAYGGRPPAIVDPWLISKVRTLKDENYSLRDSVDFLKVRYGLQLGKDKVASILRLSETV